MSHLKPSRLVLALGLAVMSLFSLGAAARPEAAFKLAPALALEAEDFTPAKSESGGGWRPIRMGEGNYAVDTIGFMHTSGERFLHLDSGDGASEAFMDVTPPVAGAYRLWVRYEYMPHTESRFKVVVEQGGKVVAEKLMGGLENPRVCPWSDGTKLAPQYDPEWGNEGITEEPMDIPALGAGTVRLRLVGVPQPQTPGVSANRNIDCLYLTSDTQDNWRQQKEYKVWYGILNAIRDTRGARYEVQFTNRGTKPMGFATADLYNRIPRWMDNADPAASVKNVAPGATTAWLPMPMQDTAHFAMSRFTPSIAQPFTVSVPPIGAAQPEETVESDGAWAGIFLPSYPGKGDKAIGVNKVLDEKIAALKASPAPGRVPTLPLCYGGSMPYNEDNAYGFKYAQLFAALGMRNTGIVGNSSPVDRAKHDKNLLAVGLKPTHSGGYMEYRCPPTPESIARARSVLTKSNALDTMHRFDYGDEIGFGEWFTYMTEQKRKESGNKSLKVEEVILPMWQAWLQKNRAGFNPQDYWRASWGPNDAGKLRPDASAEAAAEKPRLYVDSAIFYEDASIEFVAHGAQAVRDAFGPDTQTGCNYSCYPYYYPYAAMYVKWFRRGAADYGKHSEYFWQLGQVTPMINGYVSEHFRAGMRFNPKAVLSQYTMPHSPGTTDGDFRRCAFTHLAHGAKELDFFGIGMNEAATENYIDHRDTGRFIAVRDVTHSMALVEDVMEQSQVVPSEVALLVSESTERWDHARIANDHLTTGQPAREFRNDRLTFHQDRVGIYTALTFAGYAPDVVVEEDLLNAKLLNSYKVLFVVGDCLPVQAVPALEKWVKAGGVVFATASAGRFGMYHEPNPAFEKFLGVQSRQTQEHDTFMRTSQELPFLKPLGTVALDDGAGGDGQFPALAIQERVTPTGGGSATVLAKFEDGAPAVLVRSVGKGKVYYAATLPGLAYLYKGLTTPKVWVPDRAMGAHRSVTTYDTAAAGLLRQPLNAAGLSPRVGNDVGYIDTRLIEGKGVYFLPIANYNQEPGQRVTLTIRPPAGAGRPTGAISSFSGKVDVQVEKGLWVVTLPKLGYGDLVRIDVK